MVCQRSFLHIWIFKKNIYFNFLVPECTEIPNQYIEGRGGIEYNLKLTAEQKQKDLDNSEQMIDDSRAPKEVIVILGEVSDHAPP